MLKVCIFAFYSKASLKSGLLGKYLVTNLHLNLSTGSTYKMRLRQSTFKTNNFLRYIMSVYFGRAHKTGFVDTRIARRQCVCAS